jgi:hypothetical protein
VTKTELFLTTCELVGADVAVVEPGSGWPGLATVTVPNGTRISVAIHVSLVGSHSRAAYEMRFQNPAGRTPVSSPYGTLPILVGMAEVHGTPVLGRLCTSSATAA